MWTGMVVHMFFALGLVVLAGIGYLLRHARYILVASAGLNGLLLIYWWYVFCAIVLGSYFNVYKCCIHLSISLFWYSNYFVSVIAVGQKNPRGHM